MTYQWPKNLMIVPEFNGTFPKSLLTNAVQLKTLKL